MPNKISVLTWCYSREDVLNHTLQKWLYPKQEGVSVEFIIGRGPGIGYPFTATECRGELKWVDTPNLKMCEDYNAMARAATGDILLITQCDMEVNSPTQLKRMAELCNDDIIVTERFFRDGKRDIGLFCQFLMVTKKRFMEVGGFCELFDNPESAAHEDADLVSSLLEAGCNLKRIETPKEEGVYHISHPRPDYVNDPVMLKRLHKGAEIYNSRHKEGIMSLYAKQLLSGIGKKI